MQKSQTGLATKTQKESSRFESFFVSFKRGLKPI
jgi:hypothetical protein